MFTLPSLLCILHVSSYIQPKFFKALDRPFGSTQLPTRGVSCLVERANYPSCRPASVVMPSLSVLASHCSATVDCIIPALCVQLQIAASFFGLLPSWTPHCHATKTSVSANVTALIQSLTFGFAYT